MTLTNHKTIGILGGMGPDASARLYSQMITMARDEFGARENHEYPEIVIHSIPVPDFISDTVKAEEAVFMLKSRVRQLSALPLSCIAMACNAAHTTFTDLKTVTSISFLSMPEAVSDEALRKHYKRVGLLATPMTIYSGVYQSVLIEKNIELILPSDDDVEALGVLVGQIVSGDFKHSKEKLLRIADRLKKRKVDAIILGCTEIPLVFPKNYSVPVLNSIDILARALLTRYYT